MLEWLLWNWGGSFRWDESIGVPSILQVTVHGLKKVRQKPVHEDKVDEAARYNWNAYLWLYSGQVWSRSRHLFNVSIKLSVFDGGPSGNYQSVCTCNSWFTHV